MVNEHLFDAFHGSFNKSNDDFPVLNTKGFSRNDAVNQKFDARLLEIFGADEFAIAILHQAKGKRGGCDDAIDQTLRKACDRLCRCAGLDDVDPLNVIEVKDRLQREVRYRSQPTYRDSLSDQISDRFNFRFYDERLNRVRDRRRNLDDISSLQHVRD